MVLHRHGFSSSVCQVVAGATWISTAKVYLQCWKEWAGWCTQQGVLHNAISAPKLANSLSHLYQVGLAWHTIDKYCSAISAFLEPHCLHKASNHPVISKLMCHFYLQCPPSCKCFYHSTSILRWWTWYKINLFISNDMYFIILFIFVYCPETPMC